MGGGTEPAAVWQASTWRAGLVGWCCLQDHPAAPDGLALPADINECVTDLHTCSRGEHCVNTVGSFICYRALSCQPGYKVEEGRCTGEEGWLPPLTLPRPAPYPALSRPLPCPRPLALPCPAPPPHPAPPRPSPFSPPARPPWAAQSMLPRESSKLQGFWPVKRPHR